MHSSNQIGGINVRGNRSYDIKVMKSYMMDVKIFSSLIIIGLLQI